MDVAVKEENLAQAIGRNGQNVRLASQLTGWELNVMNEADAAAKGEQEARRITQTFMDQLGVDENLAAILVEEGFSTVDEVAYVPLVEMQAIDELDDETIDLLRERAKDVLLTRAIATEEGGAREPSAELLAMEGMDESLALALAARGVATLDDLAEQAVDDLMDIEGMDQERAARLIMKAREPWFANAEQD
jgi:N utilization substance protein A